MNVQYSPEHTDILNLQDNYIYLAPGGATWPYARTAELPGDAGKDPDLMSGRVLALHEVSGPHDVHYPTWEMHPEGDELIILMSGSLSVQSREAQTTWTVLLVPQTAFIVPAGIWHRLIVHEPSVLFAITPRHNTVLENE